MPTTGRQTFFELQTLHQFLHGQALRAKGEQFLALVETLANNGLAARFLVSCSSFANDPCRHWQCCLLCFFPGHPTGPRRCSTLSNRVTTASGKTVPTGEAKSARVDVQLNGRSHVGPAFFRHTHVIVGLHWAPLVAPISIPPAHVSSSV